MIKAIIGLGNPGRQYVYTRHNIGFRVVDELAAMYGGQWSAKQEIEVAKITLDGHDLMLIKPQTFMNSSGVCLSYLKKNGIQSSEILVVHDELELAFGKLAFKVGGSAKGHNGLKSIIGACGPDFHRLRFGIDRPTDREDVPQYVLATFNESADLVNNYITQALELIRDYVKNSNAD